MADPASDLHAAVSAVAAHRRDYPTYGEGVAGADAMMQGDALDEAMESARHRFHRAGGTAERADEITESAFASVAPRKRTTEFHNARQGRGSG